MSIWIVLGMCAAVIVIVIAVSVGVGAIRGGLEPPVQSRPVLTIPRDVQPADIDALRFSLAFRGYRMDEVDAVLARLRGRITDQETALVDQNAALADNRAALAERDERIAELESRASGGSC